MRRTHLFDPNMGAWTLSYNGLGELVSQIDARMIQVSFVTDRLGRTTQRSTSDGMVDTFAYDQDALGTPVKGYLGTETRNVSGGTVEYRREHYYDSHLRPAGHRTELVAESGLESFAIDIANDRYFGRPKSLTYPQVVHLQRITAMSPRDQVAKSAAASARAIPTTTSTG